MKISIDRKDSALCAVKRLPGLKHFIFKCEALKDERYRLLSIIFDKPGESFKGKPYEEQLHELQQRRTIA